MKKIICIALALVMLMGLAVSASAYDITVNNAADGSAVTEHVYEVYQIFTGNLTVDDKGTPADPADDESILTDIAYGTNYVGDGVNDLDALLALLATKSGEEAAEYIEPDLTGDPVATLDKTNGHTATGLDVGYYLIIDVTPDLPDYETSSAFILEVTDDVAINSKHTTGPIVEKKIDDTNDSTDITNEIIWHDSADHDIGDDIPFKLEMTVPSAFQLFKDNGVKYPFTFHDTEEKGLEFNNDAKVYVGDDEITSGFTVVVNPEDGHSFDVIFTDLTAIEGVAVGSVISVIYTSELTKEAVLGNMGNVNEVYGEFINYYEPEVPVYTPKDTVIAFTYEVVVNKVDENKQPLAGATFTLEKYNAATGAWEALEQVVSEAGTVFTFTGLDDGNYRLTEDAPPAGYNSIEPIEFTVTANHDIEWTNQLRTDVLTTLTGNVTTGKITFTPDVDEGTLSTDVENKSGTILPETGGVGTTIFYFLGAAMAICAVVVLVSRRRMTAQG